MEKGGLKVKTSLDLDLQNYAQATVAAEVAKVSFEHVTNGAALLRIRIRAKYWRWWGV